MPPGDLDAIVDGPSDGPWVTFVPGIGNDASFWAAQSGVLAAEGWRTLRYEPWGCGASGAPPPDTTIDTVVASILQLWDRLGVERSSVVGLGFGGSVAMLMAITHPARVGSVIACSCRSRQPEDRRQFWRDRQATALANGLGDLADITVDRWLSDAFRSTHPDVDARLRLAFRRQSVDGYRAYVGAFVEMDFTDRLGALAAPTLLIAAEHDHGGGPVDDMRAMQMLIAESELRVVEGSGHMSNQECPERVTDLIRAHLRG